MYWVTFQQLVVFIIQILFFWSQGWTRKAGHWSIDWLVDSCSGLRFPLVLISSSEPLNKVVNLTLFSWTRLRGHKTPLACHHCMKQWLNIFHLSHDCGLRKGEDVMMDWIRDKKKDLVAFGCKCSYILMLIYRRRSLPLCQRLDDVQCRVDKERKVVDTEDSHLSLQGCYFFVLF